MNMSKKFMKLIATSKTCMTLETENGRWLIQRKISEEQSSKGKLYHSLRQDWAYRYYLSGVQRYNEVKW